MQMMEHWGIIIIIIIIIIDVSSRQKQNDLANISKTAHYIG